MDLSSSKNIEESKKKLKDMDIDSFLSLIESEISLRRIKDGTTSSGRKEKLSILKYVISTLTVLDNIMSNMSSSTKTVLRTVFIGISAILLVYIFNIYIILFYILYLLIVHPIYTRIWIKENITQMSKKDTYYFIREEVMSYTFIRVASLFRYMPNFLSNENIIKLNERSKQHEVDLELNSKEIEIFPGSLEEFEKVHNKEFEIIQAGKYVLVNEFKSGIYDGGPVPGCVAIIHSTPVEVGNSDDGTRITLYRGVPVREVSIKNSEKQLGGE